MPTRAVVGPGAVRGNATAIQPGVGGKGAGDNVEASLTAPEQRVARDQTPRLPIAHGEAARGVSAKHRQPGAGREARQAGVVARVVVAAAKAGDGAVVGKGGEAAAAHVPQRALIETLEGGTPGMAGEDGEKVGGGVTRIEAQELPGGPVVMGPRALLTGSVSGGFRHEHPASIGHQGQIAVAAGEARALDGEGAREGFLWPGRGGGAGDGEQGGGEEGGGVVHGRVEPC